MNEMVTNIGRAVDRVDGPLKVTGGAPYAAEFFVPDMLHGYVVSSAIAKGRIASIDASAALAVPGVTTVLTHENSRKPVSDDKLFQDAVAPPGKPFRPLVTDRIQFSGQPVALVIADDFGTARHAASLVRVTYEAEAPTTDLEARKGDAYDPPEKRNGVPPAPDARGDAAGAFAQAAIKIDGNYSSPIEQHNPMEPHAALAIWTGDGGLKIYEKSQGVHNTQEYISKVFEIPKNKVEVLNPYMGGGFGSGLRPIYQVYLAAMAALTLKRPVRVVLTRTQMYTFGYRPATLQTVKLGARQDGALEALLHHATAVTSTFEDYQEAVVNWSGMLYDCENATLTYKLVKLDVPTPQDMRAPGATLGLFALETAMDELAYATGVDPLQLRLVNYNDRDGNEGTPFTSKELKACYSQGAEKFGWAKRSAAPRSMRDGKDLVGWGMATGAWEALVQPTGARAVLMADGKLTVGNSTSDIGTGTYTILAQIASDTMGVPLADVTVVLADSALPDAPPAGGSWTAASSGSAVAAACRAVQAKLLGFARAIEKSPLANLSVDQVTFAQGKIAMKSDPSRFVTFADAMKSAGVDKIEEVAKFEPDAELSKKYASYTHAAVFAEVKIDEELGVMRVTRMVTAVAAGAILNPKTARSQILGGIVMGIGMALEEESMIDHNLGRIMNRNFGEYHIPVNADIHDLDVIFVEEHEAFLNPIGVKGLGEIGIVGAAAAIGNAIFHATGKRIRDLPITIDKLLD
jgi:xanthine dehydrogenase YagR molybdenum-binding subunit